MRILLDECVNQRLREYFKDHDCQSARFAGFSGLKNGKLLAAAEESGFQVVITVDRGFEFQQNMAVRKIALIILCPAASIALNELIPLVPKCLSVLVSIRPGQVVKITVSSNE